MKIWIDFINSPQVSFFEPLIEDLKKEGHIFFLTCRDSANTVQLIKQKNWDYTIIGSGVNKSIWKKSINFPSRLFDLYQHLRDKDIEVAISQSSFYLPLTAKLLGVRSIYTNDNEHALGNIPSFIFATRIFVPESLDIAKVLRQGAKQKKVIQYPGVKESVYLWHNGFQIQNKRQQLEISPNHIFVRPEPYTAQYYSGKLNFLDDILVDLKDRYQITLLVRDKEQLQHYRKAKFVGISVPENPIIFEDVAINCLLFIGAGGSMTREMAIMGVPTISVYQGELLDVDKFLIKEDLMKHEPNITTVKILAFLSTITSRPLNVELLEKGKEAYKLFRKELLNK